MQKTIADARGRAFDFDATPRRIVSLVPSWTETLFASGAGASVVGITDYCPEPEAALAGVPEWPAISRIGGTKNPRVEQILALQPSLVIANVEENRRRDVEWLEARGLPCFVTFARTVRQAINEMRALGELVGAENVEAVVKPIETEYERTIQDGNVYVRPRVFVAIWKDPWMTANGETFIGDMIELSGGENIFRDRARRFPLAADLGRADPAEILAEHDTRYPRVSVDEIAEHAPEIILLPDEPYAFSERDVEELKQVKPLADARINVLDGKILSWYGVRMGKSLKMLRELIRGD